MRKITDKDLANGLRQRKNPETIIAEVRDTIVSQMHADAMRLPLDKITVSPYQVRHISEQTLEDLMESIQSTGGLISPIVVRPNGENYELIAGHTRFLACTRLGYKEIPTVVRPMNDAEAMRALAADNLTRKDLTDYEIYKLLNTLFSTGFLKSNSEASRLLGKSRQDIIRYQSYGQLPEKIIELLEQKSNLIGATIAKKLLAYLPEYTEIVIEACNRLASGQIKTQAALLTWVKQQLREKQINQEQLIIDKTGNTVGKILRANHSISLVSKTLDLEKIEIAIKLALQEQGCQH